MIQTVPLVIVILYMVGMLTVGYLTNKKLIKTSTDYMLAGRALPALFVAASLSANNIGGGSTVGVASKAFGSWGLSAGWYILAAAIGIIPLAIFAPYLRRAMAYTIPEVIGRRFGKPSHIITALLHMTSLFCLTASQILASGTIINALTGLSMNVAIITAGLITVAYTCLGGLWADAFTDMFQWIIIFFGLLLAVPFMISAAGGWGSIVSAIPAEKMSFSLLGWKTIISLMIMYFMTFLSGPEIISRFYATKNEREGVKAAVISGVTMALFAFIPAVIGLIALAKFPDIKANSALVTATFKLTPAWISGLVCAAIIAATMSSADSNMLCASTIFSKDIYQKYINPNVSDRTLITLTRSLNVIIGILAMFIALFQINIITLNVFAFMLRAAGPFAAFGLGLIWLNASRHAGLVSILAGSAVGIYWQYMKEPYGILAIIAGSVVGIAAFVLTTLIERAMGGKPAPELFSHEANVGM